MKTIADFKRAMSVGSKWDSILHRESRDGKNVEHTKFKNRTCTVSQSNSFALTVGDDGKESWCSWPKKSEVLFFDDDRIRFWFGNEKNYLEYRKIG